MDSIATLAVNTIRTLSIDVVQKANSGHPGLPLGAAPMAYVLWQKHLKHNPRNPKFPDRDRFVLSAGHGSALIYSLLHLYGYDLSMDDLKAFRQWNSKTPGHPEAFMTPGVEATTGPLGQGSATAVGMAMAERFLAGRYNRPGQTIVDHFTYALVSDGDLMEGISGEAASLAGHLKLGKLIYLWDDNKISLDGPTSMTFTEDVAKRYEAYGWQVLTVSDGDKDYDALDKAIAAAKADTLRPSMICVRTTIGFGSPKAGTSSVHGSPLGPDGVKATKQTLGFDPNLDFNVPADAAVHLQSGVKAGAEAEAAWQKNFNTWSAANPELAAEWQLAQSGQLPADWQSGLPTFAAGEKLATRQSAGKALAGLGTKIPFLLGGDADLSGSTNTTLKDAGSFDGQTGLGRNIHYGVREHAMGAIANGFAYHGGTRTFTATFFCFADYERPSVRLAALNHLPVVFVFTHDSVGLGEDGPTHQPVEHLASLRCMPNVFVVRPGDANEASQAWKLAMQRTTGPTVMVLSRQAITTLDRSKYAPAEGTLRGGYVVSEAAGGKPQAILIGTGTELALALEAQETLAAQGIAARVVSLPCWEAFDAQDAAYREQVLPSAIQVRVSIEAGATFGWERWVGKRENVVGLERFGASAPAGTIYKELGLTSDAIVARVKAQL
jgi:transketolase